MADHRDLYQDVILDHSRAPHNYRTMEGATRTVEGNNPLCGDRITLYLRIEGDRIADASFVGQGCAISKASSSLMTDAVKGKSHAEADALFERFHAMLTGGPADEAALGKLAVLSGVAAYPARVKCATMAWHTLKAALAGDQAKVSIE